MALLNFLAMFVVLIAECDCKYPYPLKVAKKIPLIWHIKHSVESHTRNVQPEPHQISRYFEHVTVLFGSNGKSKLGNRKAFIS